MHVLLFGKIPPIQGGVSRATWTAARDIADAGHSITVISNSLALEPGFRQMLTASDREYMGGQSDGLLQIHLTETVRPYAYIPWAAPYLSQLLGRGLSEAARRTPDAIVGWYFEPYGAAASLLGQILDRPVILRHAGSDLGRLCKYLDLHPLYEFALSHAARVISVRSEKTVEMLVDAGASPDAVVKARGRALTPEFGERHTSNFEELVDEAEQWFANYSLEPELLAALVAWNREGLQSTDPVIATYGKIAEVKGTYQLIEALDELVRSNVPVSYRALWSAAPARFAHAFRHLHSKQALRGRCIILPPLAPWRVPAFIRSCDIVAFLENRFPIDIHGPQIPREILACGRPLLLSSEIHSKLFFKDQLSIGVNFACVADPDDHSELTAAIKALVIDVELRNSLAHHASILSRAMEATALPRDQIVDVLEEMVA